MCRAAAFPSAYFPPHCALVEDEEDEKGEKVEEGEEMVQKNEATGTAPTYWMERPVLQIFDQRGCGFSGKTKGS